MGYRFKGHSLPIARFEQLTYREQMMTLYHARGVQFGCNISP